MALEELIVAWSKERPAWQREVMRRVAVADVFSDEDYDRLVEDIVQPRSFLSQSSVSNSFHRQRPKIPPFVSFRLRSPNT